MTKKIWDFPLLGTGNEQGYTNSGIEIFKGKELMENLAREICQNSLDAWDEGTGKPVKVEFSLTSVIKKEHEVFSKFEECVSGCERYWGNRMDSRLATFLKGVQSLLAKPELPVLLARDYNTKGLTGAKAIRTEVSVWRALAHSDGTSVNKQNDSAGSYGIGKNAPFACSDLSMVFYGTYAKDGIRAFQGVSRFATILNSNNEATTGLGHYLCVEDDGEWHPIFPENSCSFRDDFPRDEFGTDIIVVGFNGDSSWQESMIQAVLSNFFLAICENRMTVRIQDCEITSGKLRNLMEERKSASAEMRNAYECYLALTDPDDTAILHHTILTENDVDLYIKADSQFHNNVASFRSTGMRIRKYRKAIMQHFAAVVVIRGAELGALLRDTEPPRHNRWDYTLITDNKKRREQAKEALDKMDAWVLSELQKKYDSVTEFSVDSGEGDYLPDDVDFMGEARTGNDILRINHKVAGIATIEPSVGTMQTGSKKGKGTSQSGDLFGKKRRKKKKKGKKVVVEPGDTFGAKPAKSGKPLSTVNITDQRAFALKSSLGLYRVLIKSDQDYEKAYLSFFAVGEDESKDALKVEKYATNGKSENATGTQIGPISIEKDIPKEIFVTFINKEKMLLDILTTEG